MKKDIILTLYLLCTIAVFGQGKASLTVYCPVFSPDDTLVLSLQKDRVLQPFDNPYTELLSSNKDGVFRFEISNMDKNIWIGLRLSFQKRSGQPFPILLDEFLLEEGDNVTIHFSPKSGRYRSVEDGYEGNIPILYDTWNAEFHGVGADKFQLLWRVRLLNEHAGFDQILAGVDESDPNRTAILYQRLLVKALALLSAYKSKLNPDTYSLLEYQIRGHYGYELGRALELSFFYFGKEETIPTLRPEVDKYLSQGSNDLENILDGKDIAPRYIDYLVKYYWLVYTDAQKKDKQTAHWYYFCKNRLKPSFIRDRIMASFLMRNFQRNPDDKILSDALKNIQDPYSLERISLLKSLSIGKLGYNFSLPDANKIYHKADDFKGKVVFMDFWYAACTPCRKYMMNVVAPVKAHFKDNPNVVFITVSTDDYTIFSGMIKRADFLPKGGIHLYTDNQNYKHPILEYYQINAYPYPLLIGKDGKLAAFKEALSTKEGLIKAIEAAL